MAAAFLRVICPLEARSSIYSAKLHLRADHLDTRIAGSASDFRAVWAYDSPKAVSRCLGELSLALIGNASGQTVGWMFAGPMDVLVLADL